MHVHSSLTLARSGGILFIKTAVKTALAITQLSRHPGLTLQAYLRRRIFRVGVVLNVYVLGRKFGLSQYQLSCAFGQIRWVAVFG